MLGSKAQCQTVLKWTLALAVGLALTEASKLRDPRIPKDFVYGTAAAAYQVEGAWNQGGRGPSIWDTFSHTPGKVHNNDTGDVACDFYHRYHEDIALMKALGVKAFRFSISWSRILPKGRGQVNREGVAFYNNLIDALLETGIEPFVTLYHWDLPQALEDEYGGWLSDKSVPDFTAYATVCFEAFGDRVTFWTTFNEPLTFVMVGYAYGVHAPGHRSIAEAMLVTHNVLNSHAAAAAEFRRLVPRGKISMNLNSDWSEPLSDSPEDEEAAQRHLDFSMGLFADPVFKGDYPASVREALPEMPHFTPQQRQLLLGSMDYFALNHYTTRWVTTGTGGPEKTTVLTEKDGKVIGPRGDSEWLYVVPWGLRKHLAYVDKRYGHPEIYITENGVSVPNESHIPLPAALNDTFRVSFYKGYIDEALKAADEDGVNLKGYFAWSILDNFEWADGYNYRFGIVYVDYARNLTRHPKESSKWLAHFFSPDAPILQEKAEKKDAPVLRGNKKAAPVLREEEKDAPTLRGNKEDAPIVQKEDGIILRGKDVRGKEKDVRGKEKDDHAHPVAKHGASPVRDCLTDCSEGDGTVTLVSSSGPRDAKRQRVEDAKRT